MNQQIFDEHIGTAPPSTVDVDRIVRRQRRTGLVRRVSLGGFGLAASAVAIAVGFALTGSARPQSTPVGAFPHPSVSPSASSSASPGFRLETGDPKAIQQTLDQLQTALETTVAAVTPDVRWIYMPDVPGEQPLPDGHPVMYAEHQPVGFAARSGLARHGDKAGFYLLLRSDGCSSSLAVNVCSPVLDCKRGFTPATCTTSITPEGLEVLEVLEATETAPATGGKQYRFYVVQVKLPNGYHLRLNAVNYFGGDGSAVSAKQPLLTKAELRSIAVGIAAQIVV